jgi:alkanesulfonate monooxygenase SsuD/methylene tetrahydromethanopterin reductase-like flavin-dependent oxidoreductase (luciferase family)
MRETVEAMRVLWTQTEASYGGEMIRFPAVRCEPKPAQQPYPPVLLGAHGPKSLERVARTYDGWLPLVHNIDDFRKDMATLRRLTKEAGRNPDALQVTIIVDPREHGPSLDDFKRYRDAGAQRVILFSQKQGTEGASGKSLEIVKRLSGAVEVAQKA